MPEIEIRPAKSDDIPTLMALEHNYASDYVWQMEIQRDEHKVGIIFREAKLPRSVQVMYPRNPKSLADEWTQRDGILIAATGGEIVGYSCFFWCKGRF